MSPPIDRADEERLLRAVARMLDERLKPVSARVDKHSGKFVEVREEISPAVARKLSESQHDFEGANAGVTDAINRLARRIEDGDDRAARTEAAAEEAKAIAKRIEARGLVAVPDGKGSTSMVPTMIVNTEATLRTEGKADAIQVAANRSDAQSLSATRWAKLGPFITIATSAALAGVWKFIEYLLHL